MKRRLLVIIFAMMILFLFLGQQSTMSQSFKVVKQYKATLSGKIGYASMKYWIVDKKGRVIEEISPDFDDQAMMEKLDGLVGKEVTLKGTIKIYSDKSRYFYIDKDSGSKQNALDGSFKLVKGDTSNNKPHMVLFNDKVIYTEKEAQFLSIIKEYNIKSDKVALLELNSGGTMCPAMYAFITVKADGKYLVTEQFGTCSDLPKISKSGDKITMRLPGNPSKTWIYQGGKVKEKK